MNNETVEVEVKPKKNITSILNEIQDRTKNLEEKIFSRNKNPVIKIRKIKKKFKEEKQLKKEKNNIKNTGKILPYYNKEKSYERELKQVAMEGSILNSNKILKFY